MAEGGGIFAALDRVVKRTHADTQDNEGDENADGGPPAQARHLLGGEMDITDRARRTPLKRLMNWVVTNPEHHLGVTGDGVFFVGLKKTPTGELDDFRELFTISGFTPDSINGYSASAIKRVIDSKNVVNELPLVPECHYALMMKKDLEERKKKKKGKAKGKTFSMEGYDWLTTAPTEETYLSMGAGPLPRVSTDALLYVQSQKESATRFLEGIYQIPGVKSTVAVVCSFGKPCVDMGMVTFTVMQLTTMDANAVGAAELMLQHMLPEVPWDTYFKGKLPPPIPSTDDNFYVLVAQYAALLVYYYVDTMIGFPPDIPLDDNTRDVYQLYELGQTLAVPHMAITLVMRADKGLGDIISGFARLLAHNPHYVDAAQKPNLAAMLGVFLGHTAVARAFKW